MNNENAHRLKLYANELAVCCRKLEWFYDKIAFLREEEKQAWDGLLHSYDDPKRMVTLQSRFPVIWESIKCFQAGARKWEEYEIELRTGHDFLMQQFESSLKSIDWEKHNKSQEDGVPDGK